jgi:cbb3-type cytochrome oxidase subunit 3
MTAIQIYALIAIILMIAGVYWLAYRHGFNSGRAEGHSEGYDVGGCVGYRDGQAIQGADSAEEIRNLQHTLDQAHDQRKKLYTHYERALAASKLGEQERLTLLEIAEKLRIASETFSAFRTGKKLERDTRTLRDQALAIAALLEPAEQENAA